MAKDDQNTNDMAPGDGQSRASDDAQSHDVARDVVAEGELNCEQILERAVLYALEQGAEQLEQAGEFEPFTILIEGEELFIEDQPGESEEQSYASARRTVYQMERLCNAYLFCYDGYVDLEDGTSDAIVVECANKGDLSARIIVRMYHRHGDHYHFDTELYEVGEADTLFSNGTKKNEGADDADDPAATANAADGADTPAADTPAATADTPTPANAPADADVDAFVAAAATFGE
jgi:hypothetical protein